jgi:PIN domain nuclease of toxin-antitoxin system
MPRRSWLSTSDWHHATNMSIQFDRVVIVQARMESLSIVTSDSAFDNYDVRIVDARQ